MALVDLSAPISPDPRGVPGPASDRDRVLRPRRGSRRDRGLFGVRPGAASRRRGLGRGDVHAVRHPQLDPRRCSVALQLDDRGRARADDRRAAAGVVLRARASSSTSTDRADGEVLSADDVAERVPREPVERDIVLVHTGRDEFIDRARLHRPRARGQRRGDAVAVRARRAGDGDRRLGLGRAAAHAGRAREATGEPGSSGPPTSADLPYSQIERLVNLGSLPPEGFQVACFPLRLVGGSAAPARVVAILPD